MSQVMKWSLFLTMLMLFINSNHAWNIGMKGRATGPAIHTTYFLTPNNAAIPVHAKAFLGTYVSGLCNYNAVYDMGADTLKTGDAVDIDGFALKSLTGTAYNCMTIFYFYKQTVMESFRLEYDGVNYNGSLPPTGEVSVL